MADDLYLRERGSRQIWAAPARFVLGGAIALVFALVLASPAHAVEQKLTAVDGAALDQLGRSVAIDEDTLVLGAPGDDRDKGAVYVFRRSGDSWTQTAKLTASDGAESDQLGFSVAIDEDTLVLGAPGDDRDKGAVYVFRRSGDSWTQTAKLTASDGAESVGDREGNAALRQGRAGPPGRQDVPEAQQVKPRRTALHALRRRRQIHRSGPKRAQHGRLRGQALARQAALPRLLQAHRNAHRQRA